jgi:hypothetical protein
VRSDRTFQGSVLNRTFLPRRFPATGVGSSRRPARFLGADARETAGALGPKGRAMPENPSRSRTPNRILSRLSREDFALLEPHLAPVDLPVRKATRGPEKAHRSSLFHRSWICLRGGKRLEQTEHRGRHYRARRDDGLGDCDGIRSRNPRNRDLAALNTPAV